MLQLKLSNALLLLVFSVGFYRIFFDKLDNNVYQFLLKNLTNDLNVQGFECKFKVLPYLEHLY